MFLLHKGQCQSIETKEKLVLVPPHITSGDNLNVIINIDNGIQQEAIEKKKLLNQKEKR